MVVVSRVILFILSLTIGLCNQNDSIQQLTQEEIYAVHCMGTPSKYTGSRFIKLVWKDLLHWMMFCLKYIFLQMENTHIIYFQRKR